MEYIGDVIYDYADGLYFNITNRCPCSCDFCIRNLVDSLGDADSLWLKREPSVDEVMEMLQEWDLSRYSEIVFCGYGEPTERLEELLEITRRIKSTHPDMRCRVNTNGLSDLINGRKTAGEFAGVIDAVSISLNAATDLKYLELCHPVFGVESFEAIKKFTSDIKAYVPDVTMSIVGGTIPSEDEPVCRDIAEKLGVKFRRR